jgi:hypothetical protein
LAFSARVFLLWPAPAFARLAAAGGLGAAVRRAYGGIVGWSAEQTGGVDAVSALLMAKFAQLADDIANLIAAARADLDREN